MRIGGDGLQLEIVSFEIPVGVKRRIDTCADVLRCSRSALLRTLIDRHLKDLCPRGTRRPKGTMR